MPYMAVIKRFKAFYMLPMLILMKGRWCLYGLYLRSKRKPAPTKHTKVANFIDEKSMELAMQI